MQKSGCYVECYTGKHRTVIHPPERSLTTRQSKETNNDDVNEASPTTTPMRTGAANWEVTLVQLVGKCV